MGICVNHPDRKTSYLCMKHQLYLCDECLNCRDPEIYCKYRSSCPIWFMNKRKKKRDAEVKQVAPNISMLKKQPASDCCLM